MAATFQHVAYHKAKSGNEDEKTECNTLFNYIAICHLFDAEVKKRGSTTNSTEWHIWSGEMKNKLKVKNIKGKIFEYLSWYSPNVLWYIRIILNHIVTPWLQSGQVSRWFSNFLYMTFMSMPQHRNPCLGVINFYNFGEGFHVETPIKCVNFFILHVWLLKKKSIGFCFIYHIRWIHKMFQ